MYIYVYTNYIQNPLKIKKSIYNRYMDPDET